MTNRKRMGALLLCIGLVLVLLVSSVYIVREAQHHHCTGLDCDVCQCIEATGRLLRGFSALALLLVLLRAVRALIARFRRCEGRVCLAKATPVALKIRLNN
ncbi:MAG: hypothetical protein IJ662_11000 [Clostridia bacterium]|nr:hypothetical protein [Clostridia bacterium]